MKRIIDWHLKRWKNNPSRKPLLLRGARQVGKTYAARKLGEQFDNFIELNFELAKDAREIFLKNLDPKRILREISLITGEKIIPGKTFLFFDEVQEAPEAIQSLRYFYEKIPKLHVIAAGSLLDFAIEKVGLPVGRVSSLYLYPLSFMEFLAASHKDVMFQEILVHEKGIPIGKAAHEVMLDQVGQYLAIGGMPEAVFKWTQTENPRECFQIHHDLIEGYRQDFLKYASKHQIKYLEQLFREIPHMTGEQFQYKNVQGEYRKRELSPCLDLLCMANVIHRIYHSSGRGSPIGSEANLKWFKLIFLDVALCQAILGFDLATWFIKSGHEFINRGQIIEAFVGQEILAYGHPGMKTSLYFWRRGERSSSAEVDYLIDDRGAIIPIEVKNTQNGKLKSMHLFLKNHPQTPYGIRFSPHNYHICDSIDSRPLYAVATLAHPDQQEAIASLIPK